MTQGEERKYDEDAVDLMSLVSDNEYDSGAHFLK